MLLGGFCNITVMSDVQYGGIMRNPVFVIVRYLLVVSHCVASCGFGNISCCSQAFY